MCRTPKRQNVSLEKTPDQEGATFWKSAKARARVNVSLEARGFPVHDAFFTLAFGVGCCPRLVSLTLDS